MGIVPRAFLRVGKDLVRGLDFGEFPSRVLGVMKVAVGM